MDPAAVPQTIEQRRAAFALKRIINTVNTKIAANELKAKEFRAYAQELPAMIRMNGLGQAAAFSKMKGGSHGELYNIVSEWMTQAGQPLEEYDDLLTGITKTKMFHYRVAQTEAMALMEWVRKFATAFLDEDNQSESEEASDD